MRTWMLAAAISVTVVTSFPLAHKGATGVVKMRMDQMGEIGKATKAIGEMMKGSAPYDADRVAELALRIGEAGGKAITRHFPEGSINGPSEARPEIWQDWQKFEDLSADLRETALALSAGAGNPRDAGEEAPDALFRDMAATCKSCHQDFRIKK